MSHASIWCNVATSERRTSLQQKDTNTVGHTGTRRGDHISPVLRQCFQSRDELTSNWRALSSGLCPYLSDDIHLVSADRALFHEPTTRSATEVLLPPGHASGTT